MQNKHQIRHQIIAIFLAILFVNYICDTTMFVHSHQVGNKIICHSHPFGVPNHTHSLAGLNTIHLLSDIIIMLAAFKVTGLLFLHLIRAIKSKIALTKSTQQYLSLSLLRAPPFAF